MPKKSKTPETNPTSAVDTDIISLPIQVVEKVELPPIQWSDLAYEIKLNVFSFLSPNDLLKQQTVSKTDYVIAKDDTLWNQKIRNFPSYHYLVYQNKQKMFFALRNEKFKTMQKEQVVLLQAIIDEDLTTLKQLVLRPSDLWARDTNNKNIKTYLFECTNQNVKNWAYQSLKPKFIDDSSLLEAAMMLGQGLEELNAINARKNTQVRTSISDCITYNRLDFLKELHSANPNSLDIFEYFARFSFRTNTISESRFNSTLMLATAEGHVEIISFLLSKGVSVNQQNSLGQTALHIAVLSDHTQCVARLLNHVRTNKKMKDSEGNTAIHIAAKSGDLKSIKLLLDVEPFIAQQLTELQSRTTKNKTLSKQEQKERVTRNTFLKRLLSIISVKNSYGENSLSIAASQGFTEIVKHCLDVYALWKNSLNLEERFEHESKQKSDTSYNNKYDIFLTESNHNPLIKAILNGHNEIAQLLIEAGMPLEIQGARSPVHEAVRQNNLYVLKCILSQSKKQLNFQDHSQQTPLIHAAANGHVEIVRYLLKKKPDLNVATVIPAAMLIFAGSGHNQTALHWAAAISNVDIVELLVLAGAQETPFMRRSLSASILLAQAGKLEAIRVLAQNNPAVLNDRDSYHRTVLMFAAENGNLELVQYLLEQGVETHHVSTLGSNCMDFALDSGNTSVVFEFIRHGVIGITSEDKLWRLLNLVENSELETAEKEDLIKKLCFYILDNDLSAKNIILKVESMYPNTWLGLQDSAGEALIFKLMRYKHMSEAFLENHLNNIDVNQVDEDNKSLIYHAVESKNYKAVNALLKCKPILNTLPSPLHCLLEQTVPNSKTFQSFIEADPELVSFKDEEGVSILDKMVTKKYFDSDLEYFYQKVPSTEAGDSIKRQALLSALQAKKWDNAAKLMLWGTTIDPEWYQDSDLNIPSPEKLALILYVEKRSSQGFYKTYLSFFGCKIMGLGYSRIEKVDAARALRSVCLDGGSSEDLFFHRDALSDGELGEICKKVMPF